MDEIIKKQNFCWIFPQTSLHWDSKECSMFLRLSWLSSLPYLPPRVSLSTDADAFHWSVKWSFRCLPVNRAPVKRRLLSWQLPGKQTTDVRAPMIAWSEDTWWEAAAELQSRPVWDRSSRDKKSEDLLGGWILKWRIFAPFWSSVRHFDRIRQFEMWKFENWRGSNRSSQIH